MPRIKVAFLTTSLPLNLESVSGAFITRLVDHLAKHVDVTVVTPAHRDYEQKRFQRGAATVVLCSYAPKRLQRVAQVPGGIPTALKANRLLYLLVPGLVLSMFATCFREARYCHVIHANWAICGCIAGLVGALRGVPVITTLRGDDVTRATRSRLDKYVLRWSIALSDRVTAVSSDMVDRLAREFPHYRDKLSVVENGVEESFLSVGDARQYIERGAPTHIITVSSLIPRKGVDCVIRALSRMRLSNGLTLRIVGAGPEEANLRAIATEEGVEDRVEFLGARAIQEIPALLAQADIFVLASHSEGRPNALVEAMAAGLPVVATRIAGVTELVRNEETGLLFEPNDIDQLAAHLQRLHSDHLLRARLGDAAHRFIIASNLSWQRTVANYQMLYQELTVVERTLG